MALDALINRQPTSQWRLLLEAPLGTLARVLHSKRSHHLEAHQPPVSEPAVTVVCISDTHNLQPSFPPGDLLVHAGDLTQNGTVEELQRQLDWLNQQPHQHKVVIAGNHDIALDDAKHIELGRQAGAASRLWCGSIHYLQDSTVSLKFRGGRTLVVYGSPWTRKHGNWAFQYEPGVDKFSGRIDSETDVLVTHSPPKTHLDLANWGDEFLRQELWRVKPRLHVFGHIHGGYGKEMMAFGRFDRLYERVLVGDAGLVAVLWMLVSLLLGLLGFRPATSTVLVNAASVGGLRDRYRNGPWVVRLRSRAMPFS